MIATIKFDVLKNNCLHNGDQPGGLTGQCQHYLQSNKTRDNSRCCLTNCPTILNIKR
jgi:hypothetical protein